MREEWSSKTQKTSAWLAWVETYFGLSFKLRANGTVDYSRRDLDNVLGQRAHVVDKETMRTEGTESRRAHGRKANGTKPETPPVYKELRPPDSGLD